MNLPHLKRGRSKIRAREPLGGVDNANERVSLTNWNEGLDTRLDPPLLANLKIIGMRKLKAAIRGGKDLRMMS
jgi:hypothetical protein